MTLGSTIWGARGLLTSAGSVLTWSHCHIFISRDGNHSMCCLWKSNPGGWTVWCSDGHLASPHWTPGRGSHALDVVVGGRGQRFSSPRATLAGWGCFASWSMARPPLSRIICHCLAV